MKKQLIIFGVFLLSTYESRGNPSDEDYNKWKEVTYELVTHLLDNHNIFSEYIKKTASKYIAKPKFLKKLLNDEDAYHLKKQIIRTGTRFSNKNKPLFSSFLINKLKKI